MAGRADALVSAADLISTVHDLAQTEPDLRATVGTCRVQPGVPNGIPDLAALISMDQGAALSPAATPSADTSSSALSQRFCSDQI